MARFLGYACYEEPCPVALRRHGVELLLVEHNWQDFVCSETLQPLRLVSQSSDARTVSSAMRLVFVIDVWKEEGADRLNSFPVA